MADDFKVTLRINVDQARLESTAGPIIRRRLASITRRIANQARVDVPVLTGNLGRSIREDDIKMAGPLKAEGGVTAHADYAAAVHEGSRPHIIRPRRAQALRFEVGGRTVYARMVRHPGTKARPFLRNAAERIISAER